MDRNVEPLPFHGMSACPYPAPESYPSDPAHLDYLSTYNTRVENPSPCGSPGARSVLPQPPSRAGDLGPSTRSTQSSRRAVRPPPGSQQESERFLGCPQGANAVAIRPHSAD